MQDIKLTLEERLEVIFCLAETWLEESENVSKLNNQCFMRLKTIKSLSKRDLVEAKITEKE